MKGAFLSLLIVLVLLPAIALGGQFDITSGYGEMYDPSAAEQPYFPADSAQEGASGPSSAGQQSAAGGSGITLQSLVGLFNIFVGLMLTASILLFGTGLCVWIIRLGTIHREDGIHIMVWAVNVLFVLVIVLALVQFFQKNVTLGYMIAAVLILLFILWLAFKVLGGGGEPAKDEEH